MFIKTILITNCVEQENSLERKIKKFDWKEWTPFVGLYFAPRNILKREESQSLDGRECLNGCYHGLVSSLPTIYAICQIAYKYL